MANLIASNSTNFTTKEGKTQNVSNEPGLIAAITFNSIACPFTVQLNVLVLMAVKRRPRLQSSANILLACLAVTDAFIGLTAQPSFVLWKTLFLLGTNPDAVEFFHLLSVSFLSLCSCLHLILVVGERLVAIKFTFRHPYIVTTRNIKLAVSFCWIYTALCLVATYLGTPGLGGLQYLFLGHILVSCIVFVSLSYVILYFETRRHQKMIKTQQLPQREAERFIRESKALQTTVFVVGAVVLCLLPATVYVVPTALGLFSTSTQSLLTYARTSVMLNSLVNPLIYCWRQKEIRKFVFRSSTQVVHPID